jgi:hypothetical protein
LARAVVLERNKLVGRRIARCFLAAGIEVTLAAEPAEIGSALDGASVLAADTFDGDLVLDAVRLRPHLRGILWTGEPLKRSLRYVIETPQISNVLGRKDFESAPRSWELAMVIRRIMGSLSPSAERSEAGRERGVERSETSGPPRAKATHVTEPPPMGAYLAWGYHGIELSVGTAAARDEAVARVQALITALQVPKRVAEMFGELAHELLMNAIYDAPVDAHGRPRFAQDRKGDVALAAHEHAILRAATDGNQVALQVRDPFGRLERRHVMDGLARGLAGGELDTTGGGAGLGMMVCHNSSAAMFFDVVRGRLTEVTATFELDLNLRDFRTQAKSLHYFES